MRAGLDHEPGTHDVAQAHPSLEPAVSPRAEQPAQRAHRGEHTEADVAQAELLTHVEHHDRHRRAERDVERHHGDRERAHRAVLPQPAQTLGDLPPRVPLAVGSHGQRERDADQQQRTGDEQHHLRGERPGDAHREQERADRRAGELVDDDVSAHDPGVRDAQVGGLDDHRQQRVRRRVDEHLGGTEQEHRAEHHADVHGVEHHHRHHHGEHGTAGDVRERSDEPTVVAVGDDAGVQAEQQPRQALQQRRHRHQQRVVGLRRHEQWTGRETDAVTEVGDPRRREEAPVSRSQARRDDRVEDRTHGPSRLSVAVDRPRSSIRPRGMAVAARGRRVYNPSSTTAA